MPARPPHNIPPEEESSAGKKPEKEGFPEKNSRVFPKKSKNSAPEAAAKKVQVIASVVLL
jgi:hypothetical protein